MTCAFFGHAQLPADPTLSARLEQAVEQAARAGATEFLVGGMGEFDRRAAGAVCRVRARQSGLRLHLVIPYRTKKLNDAATLAPYDSIVYPEEVWGVHPRYAIDRRNRWMVRQAGLVIAFVDHRWGGAWQAYSYAKRRKIQTVNLAGDEL